MALLSTEQWHDENILINPVGGDGNPVGAVVLACGGPPNSNYLECDGSIVSQATEAELFAAIGLIDGGLGDMSWAGKSTGTTDHLRDVAKGVDGDYNERWIAVGDGGKIVASDDQGATWIAKTSGIATDLTNIRFFGQQGVWIAIGYSNVVRISTDGGETWSAPTTAPSGGTAWHGIAINSNDRIVIVGDYYASYSDDYGDTWSAVTNVTGSTNYLYDVAADGSTNFVCVGTNGECNSSTDGASWSGVTAFTAANLQGITYAQSRFHAVGVATETWWSANGTSGWTQGTVDTLNTYSITDVQGVENILVATGFRAGEGVVLWSYDNGVNWDVDGSVTTEELMGLYASVEQTMVVGGTAATSGVLLNRVTRAYDTGTQFALPYAVPEESDLIYCIKARS